MSDSKKDQIVKVAVALTLEGHAKEALELLSTFGPDVDENVLAAIVSVIPRRGSLNRRQLMERVIEEIENRGWRSGPISQKVFDATLQEAQRLGLVEEAHGSYQSPSGTKPPKREDQEDRLNIRKDLRRRQREQERKQREQERNRRRENLSPEDRAFLDEAERGKKRK